MPFDWEKFTFEAVTEEEKAILYLFQQKHPEEYQRMQPSRFRPIQRERYVVFFFGWFTGLQDGRFISDNVRMDLDCALGQDLCKKCPEFNENDVCDDFPCEKIQPTLKGERK